MDNALNELFHAIALDFAEWRSRGEYGSLDDYDQFLDKLYVEEGRKYLKIVKEDGQKTVWGFIVKEDDKKFKAGDILKAASWASPARNKARGNILDGGYNIRWTGPNYL
jgi:hypothetical protein